MANYATLKAAVADVVKTNGNQSITGANLQTVLLSIINSIGANYTFAGVATPSTVAGTPDQNIYYITGSGTFSNMGDTVTIPDGVIGIFKYNGSWATDQIKMFDGIDSAPSINSTKLVESGGVYSQLRNIDNVLYTQKEGDYTEQTPAEITGAYYVNYHTGEKVYLWGTQTIKVIVKGFNKIKMTCLTVTSGTVQGYAFMDDNDNYITGEQRPFGDVANSIVVKEYNIPENAAYILQTWSTAQAGNFSAQCSELVNDENRIEQIIEHVDDLDIYNLENAYSIEDDNSVELPNTIKNNYYVNFTNGNEVSLYGRQIRRIDNLELYSKIVISCVTSVGGTAVGYALFDKNDNFLYGNQTIADGVGDNVVDQTINIPKGASYILQSFSVSKPTFTAIGYARINQYDLALRLIQIDRTYQNTLASFIWDIDNTYEKEDGSTSFPTTRKMNPDNVVVSNGELILKTTKVSSSPLQYDCAGIDIYPNTLYPTIENAQSLCMSANIEMAKMSGLNQAFWAVGAVDNLVAKDFIENHTTGSYDASATYKYEVDIEFNYPNKCNCSIHLWKTNNGTDTGMYTDRITLLVTDTDSHNYMFGWNEKEIFWCVNSIDIAVMPNYFVSTAPTIIFTQKVASTFGEIDTTIEECATKIGMFTIRTAVAENLGTMKFINGVPYWWNGTAWVNANGQTA